mgnify:CR=1 FL=1
MKIILIILVVGVVLWSAYGYFAVRNIEEPAYTVVEERGGYEIRTYAPHLVAETRVEGTFNDALNQGFRLIADYIFGNNTESSQIAMTVPVAEQKGVAIAMTVPVAEVQDGGLRVISFVMPSKYTLATIPKPNNSKVKLREVPERTMAVLSYSWWSGSSYVESQKKALVALVTKDGLTSVGEPEDAFYNPPWTPPFLLRNEILLEIQR